MRLDERWLWLGETISARDAGLVVFQAYPDCFWIAVGDEMIGPLDDRTILRAVRVGSTPTIDGCECGPTKLGITELSPRRPLRRGRGWCEVSESELPPSVTVYDARGLEPVSGCSTRFDAMPTLARGTTAAGWEAYVDERPAYGGALAASWNAHPTGSSIFARQATLESGFVVVDFARPSSP